MAGLAAAATVGAAEERTHAGDCIGSWVGERIAAAPVIRNGNDNVLRGKCWYFARRGVGEERIAPRDERTLIAAPSRDSGWFATLLRGAR